MQIAVTGATGRVGRAVAACAVADGHQVVGVDRVAVTPETSVPGVSYLACDTTSHDELASALRGCQGLIHLAAYPSPHGRPDHETFNNNVTSSYNALSIAVASGMRRVCQASSINAIGSSYSRRPTYEYLPLDERHPTYNEDPYALSKWVCEEQAASLCRLHSDLAVASMRFNWVCPSRDEGIALRESHEGGLEGAWRDLWGYTVAPSAARACVDAVAGSSWVGAEAFYLCAPRVMARRPSAELVAERYPEVPLRRSLVGDEGLYDCSKAARLLGWHHPMA